MFSVSITNRMLFFRLSPFLSCVDSTEEHVVMRIPTCNVKTQCSPSIDCAGSGEAPRGVFTDLDKPIQSLSKGDYIYKDLPRNLGEANSERAWLDN